MVILNELMTYLAIDKTKVLFTYGIGESIRQWDSITQIFIIFWEPVMHSLDLNNIIIEYG